MCKPKSKHNNSSKKKSKHNISGLVDLNQSQIDTGCELVIHMIKTTKPLAEYNFHLIHFEGLPQKYKDSVRAITPGLPLFLYNYTAHQLHGVYQVCLLLITLSLTFGLISFFT